MNPDIESMAELLGSGVLEVLQEAPFSEWSYEASDDPKLGRTNHVFRREGVDLVSDRSGIVSTVFLYASSERRFEPGLADLPFDWSRTRVRAALGTPSRSGEGLDDSLLGLFGPWDRYDRAGFDIHVQFVQGGDAIELLTFTRTS